MVGIGTKLQGVNLMAHNSTDIIILFFVSRCWQHRKALSDLSILTKHLRIHRWEALPMQTLPFAIFPVGQPQSAYENPRITTAAPTNTPSNLTRFTFSFGLTFYKADILRVKICLSDVTQKIVKLHKWYNLNFSHVCIWEHTN